MFVLNILLLLANVLVALQAQEVIVTIPNGQMKGRIEYSLRNLSFYAFQSVPYAKPPVDELRLKDPQPAEAWEGIYDATRLDGNICYQFGTTDVAEKESEDCLYLNVYTPVYPDASAGLPVMVYIHGGAFLNGHSNFYGAGPHYLMEDNVLVVTVLYRLGSFGFLSTGDTTIPGNFGLKDQALALQWVHDNIQYFGGDPNKVTIFGQSAGASSVTFHALSKLSKGLFRAAIAESGTALCPWAYNRMYKENAYRVAANLGSSLTVDSSSEELLAFLRTVPAEDMRTASAFEWSLSNQGVLQGFDFTPVIEPSYDGAFLTENMYDVIYAGTSPSRVPLLIGFNSEEMLSQAADIASLTWLAQSFDGNLSYVVNNNMHITDEATLNVVGEAIRSIYTDGLFQDNLAKTIKFYSDSAFTKSIIQHAKLQSQWSNVYFYEFSYHGELPGNNIYLEGADRVQHSEELGYIWVWGNQSNLNDHSAADILTSNRLRKLFTNFAKELNPTPTSDELFNNVIWSTFTPSNSPYLNINDSLTMEINPRGDVFPGWVTTYAQHAVKPLDTF